MSSNPDEPQTESQAQTDSAADDLSEATARIAELEKQLAEASERADRYHANWQRSAADFQNWKRRTDQEKAEMGRIAEGAMTLELLRVLDDFERAFMALPAELRSLTWIEGVYMIGQKLFALLQARGLSPIDAQGQEFDPFLHEAVLREEGAEGSDSLVVVQELQRGYRFHERVIRPTMVKVGKPASTAAPDDATTVPSEAADVVDSDGASESSGDSEQPMAS
ncbi:MAG TPA: nucleotide exchange factor GrpE [Chloroflexota bacterium]|nr:nucleotide exchange factor GrpE [Chloroflexota bacterium]